MATTIALIDTNILLHFQDIESVDWRTALAADRVQLVLAPVVIAELDAKKNDASAKTRKRAGVVIVRLFKLSDQGNTIALRDGVELELHPIEPCIDFAANRLDRNRPDDRLIASALEYKQHNAETRVLIVTSDMGMTLKARHHHIDVVRLPDTMKLPEEMDGNEKKIQDLEKELTELKRAIPDIRLQFTDGSVFQKFELLPPITVTAEQQAREKALIRHRHPPREIPTVNALPALAQIMSEFQKMGVAQYNAALEKFFDEYDRWVDLKSEAENYRRRTVRLELQLVNEGSAPTQDIDLFLHFPDGFELLDDESIGGFPEEPVPPNPAVHQSPFPGLGNALRFNPIMPNLGKTAKNASGPTIRQSHSYDVDFHVCALKHGLVQELDHLFVVFNSFDGAFSFPVEYQILAANMPNKIEGTLNIVIKKRAS